MEKVVVDLLRPDHLRQAGALWGAPEAEPGLISAVDRLDGSEGKPGPVLQTR
jgi:hypothetical protein